MQVSTVEISTVSFLLHGESIWSMVTGKQVVISVLVKTKKQNYVQSEKRDEVNECQKSKKNGNNLTDNETYKRNETKCDRKDGNASLTYFPHVGNNRMNV